MPQRRDDERPTRTDRREEPAAPRRAGERDEERRQPVRDDEHDGGFGDGPLV